MKPALATGPVFLWTQLTRIRATAPPSVTKGFGGNDFGRNDLLGNDF
jgi:hypothetical protein